MIKIIQSTQEWNDFRPQWEELYKSSSATPFQSFAFQYSSWNNMVNDGTLHIIVIIRDKDKSNIAIFPTYIDRCGILRFINGRHIDFCSALVSPEFERDYHLYEELADYIKCNCQIKGFELDNLKENNYLSSVLCYLFKGSLVSITNHWSFCRLHPVEPSHSVIDAFNNLNKKEKYRLKNILTKSQTLSFNLYSVDDQPYPTDIVRRLVDNMIESGIRTEAYFSAEFLKVIEDAYNDSIISLGVTLQDDEPLSCNLYLCRENEYVNWIAIYKNGKENTINLLKMGEYIGENGGGVLNFARGLYQYKVHNFRPEIHNLYKISYRKSNCGKIGLWMNVCIYYLKQVVKSIIRK